MKQMKLQYHNNDTGFQYIYTNTIRYDYVYFQTFSFNSHSSPSFPFLDILLIALHAACDEVRHALGILRELELLSHQAEDIVLGVPAFVDEPLHLSLDLLQLLRLADFGP